MQPDGSCCCISILDLALSSALCCTKPSLHSSRVHIALHCTGSQFARTENIYNLFIILICSNFFQRRLLKPEKLSIFNILVDSTGAKKLTIGTLKRA